MKEKIVKTRKSHICEECGDEINIGSNALFSEIRIPKYDGDCDDGIQIGIIYLRNYFCINCVNGWKNETRSTI